MEISFIVPSYQGRPKLPRILEAIAQQVISCSQDAWEVVIVLDGSTDGSQEWLAGSSYPRIPHLQVIEQENQGRAATRNRGANAAQGELLIFFDDDMRPLPECTQVHMEHHQKNPGSILVGSQLEDPQRISQDIHHFRAYLSNKWTQEISPSQEKVRIPEQKPYITAANFSLSKTLFKQLGQFDERLKDAEDFDLAIRATAQSVPIYFDPQAQAWHDELVSAAYMVKRWRQYAQSHQTLKTLKPEQMEAFLVRSAPQPSLVKKILYNIMAHRLWVNMIDGWNLFRVFPQSIRFRIYDVIITGLSTYYPERPL